MKKYNYLTFIGLLFLTATYAQRPVPAKPQEKPVALIGGIAHLGNGNVIQNSVIGFDKGKLTIVADASASVDLSGYEVIKIAGKHVYPGFILPDSQIGLEEVSSVGSMNDYNERGVLNPNVRAVISYNTDSEIIPTLRFNGVLLAETTPTGGLISGSSSVMEMEGWNWEDATHSADIGIHVNWPHRMQSEMDYSTFTTKEVPNKEYDKQVQLLSTFFADALAYGRQPSKEINLKLESMQGLFDGKKTLFIHSEQPKEIVESIRFAQSHNVKRITLITNWSAYYVADFLKENSIPVIIPEPHNLPERADDDADLIYRLPYLLSQAGISVGIYSAGMLNRSRNLAFYAGTAAAYGMEKEEALKTITLNTAKALGIDKRVGSLEVGKDATLFISEGDALDCKSNILTHAFISGKLVTLPGNQQELYERYSEKYGIGR
ncbi:MAG TPA: amidohydrolase family protein [Cyclobacteriaceae bacterium]|nr:amidohydrolase family protein [Cyclobacteriaceae bacterium]